MELIESREGLSITLEAQGYNEKERSVLTRALPLVVRALVDDSFKWYGSTYRYTGRHVQWQGAVRVVWETEERGLNCEEDWKKTYKYLTKSKGIIQLSKQTNWKVMKKNRGCRLRRMGDVEDVAGNLAYEWCMSLSYIDNGRHSVPQAVGRFVTRYALEFKNWRQRMASVILEQNI